MGAPGAGRNLQGVGSRGRAGLGPLWAAGAGGAGVQVSRVDGELVTFESPTVFLRGGERVDSTSTLQLRSRDALRASLAKAGFGAVESGCSVCANPRVAGIGAGMTGWRVVAGRARLCVRAGSGRALGPINPWIGRVLDMAVLRVWPGSAALSPRWLRGQGPNAALSPRKARRWKAESGLGIEGASCVAIRLVGREAVHPVTQYGRSAGSEEALMQHRIPETNLKRHDCATG